MATTDNQFSSNVDYRINNNRIILTILGVSILLGVMTFFLPFAYILAGLGLLFITLAILIDFRIYQIVFVIFCFLLYALFDLVGYFPLLDFGLKIYLADGVILFLGIMLVYLIAGKIPLSRFNSPITGLLFVNLIYGFIAIIVGFYVGHNFSNVIGDFRRFFFYPLSFLVGLVYFVRISDVRRLFIALILALIVISAFAIYRVVTDQTWQPDKFSEDFRAMSFVAGVVVLLGIGVFFGYGLTNPRNRLLSFTIVTFLVGIVLVSGYRLLWVATPCITLFVTLSVYRGAKHLNKLLIATVVSFGSIVLGLFVAKLLFPDLYLLMLTKFETRVLGFQFSENIRFFAWNYAWKEFLSSPLLGIGIGDQFSFYTANSKGFLQLVNMTTHNHLMSILYQSGILGAGIFIVLMVKSLNYVWRQLAKCSLETRGVLSGILGSFLAALALAMFQPFLEDPSATVGFYLLLGLMLKIIDLYSKISEILSL